MGNNRRQKYSFLPKNCYTGEMHTWKLYSKETLQMQMEIKCEAMFYDQSKTKEK